MRTHLKKCLFALVLTMAFGSTSPAIRADDAYYMMIFASEGRPNLARHAHTFATFVKIPESDGGQPDLKRIKIDTISWMPATLRIMPLRPRPEVGRNLSLQESLQVAQGQNALISAWGPYRIKKELYDRAIAQVNRLNRGEILYKALDASVRPMIGSNCFHAVSDIADGPLLDTGMAYGDAASEMVRDHLSRWIIPSESLDRSLLEPLGLANFPINYRD